MAPNTLAIYGNDARRRIMALNTRAIYANDVRRRIMALNTHGRNQAVMLSVLQ